ncbi:capsule biosynthesis protein [uncultured Enterovirga sp.]|uniref:capsule biosynthesis protein n=1 Tax=uncultured Enterovirga sp. TaxID=2026352 RepID=UPI0035CA8C59
MVAPVSGVQTAVERASSDGRAVRTYRKARSLFRRNDPPVPRAQVAYLPSDLPRTSHFPIGPVSFAICVLVPAIVAAIYFALLATSQYSAEMRFVIRQGAQDTGRSLMSSVGGVSGAGGSAAGGALAVAAGGGSSGTAAEDAHIVTSYIHSRAMIDDISKVVNLREIFRRPEADFYARLGQDVTADELLTYWTKMTTTAIEGTSAIVTVIVRAFRPEDAVLLAEAVQRLSEKLVNDISARARRDTLQRATDEVARAQGLMTEALRELERYRNAEGLIDPIQTATETGRLLTRVLTDQLTAENQLFVMQRSLGADSPTVRNLQTRVDTLRKQTTALREQMAGTKGDTRNVASALVRFEEILVKQKVAETLYALAEGGLDRARRSAEARSVYLTPFVRPSLPEEASYPKRVMFPIAVAVICLVLWSIVALIWASVEDHRMR